MKKSELLEKVKKSDQINYYISEGNDLITNIYWGGGICPKVKVLFINWEAKANVLVLENTNPDAYNQSLKKGEIIFYMFSKHEIDNLIKKIEKKGE